MCGRVSMAMNTTHVTGVPEGKDRQSMGPKTI